MPPTITDLGAGNSNVNPATSVTMTTTAAIADGESVTIGICIPNDNPTGLSVTVAGNTATEVVRASRTGFLTTILVGYKNATGGSLASGSTISASWTNTGTQQGGGAMIDAGKADQLVSPTTADTTGTGNAFNATPTATSGTPSSSTKDYLAVTVLGVLANTAAGQGTPPTGYTAYTESFQASRLRSVYAAARAFTAAVSAQTAAWTVSWGASKNWAEVVALFEVTASGLTVTAPAAAATAAVPTVTVWWIVQATTGTFPSSTTNPSSSMYPAQAAQPNGRATAPVPTLGWALVTPPATSTAAAPAPNVPVTLASPAAATTGSAPAPVLGRALVVPQATATGTAPAPTVAFVTGPITIVAPPAAVTAAAPAGLLCYRLPASPLTPSVLTLTGLTAGTLTLTGRAAGALTLGALTAGTAVGWPSTSTLPGPRVYPGLPTLTPRTPGVLVLQPAEHPTC